MNLGIDVPNRDAWWHALSPQNCGRDLDARTQVHAPRPEWLPRENHHASHSIGIWLVPAESVLPLMPLSPRYFYTRESSGYKNLPWLQKSSRHTLGFSLYSYLLVWDIVRPCRGAPADSHEPLIDCISGAARCRNEARSFVTYLQDKVIMVKRIMCNAKMERCTLGDCGWLRLGNPHPGAALAPCRLPSSLGNEPYGGRLRQPLTVFTISGFLIRFFDAF